MRRFGRAVMTIAAIMLLLTFIPAAGPAKAATISWSRVWDWLTAHATSLSVPVQQSGTAAGKPHHVPAAATRAGRGTGGRPGKGAGQLRAFAVHGRTARRVSTGPGFGNGSHSFNARTSSRVASRSSATSTLFRNADGTYTRMVYAGPVNYRAPDGTWQPVNTTLQRGSDGRYHQEANSFKLSLAGQAGESDLVNVGFDGGSGVSYALSGARNVQASVSGPTARYPGVLPGTDLVLRATGGGLKESLVLNDVTAPTSWVFPLKLTGVTARIAADGSVEFLSPAGTVLGRIPHGFMRDSSVRHHSGDPAVSGAVTYQLVTAGGQPALRVTVDAAWLRTPGRVFPVTVDPNYSPINTTETDNLYPYDLSTQPDMDIGTYNNGGEVARSFLDFSGLGSALSGEHITSAYLHLFDYWAATCTPEPFYVAPITQSWSPTGVSSFPGPSYGSSIGSLTANPGAACGNTGGDETIGTWMTAGLSTNTFNSWTTGGADNGLAIYADESGDLSWKRFSSDNGPNPPFLELNYTPDVPPQIDSMYPPDNQAAPTLTPELIASGHDPDNWPSALQYDFTVYDSSGTVVADSGKVSTPDWVVPDGKLSWSHTYYWMVQDYDGYTFSNSSTINYFTTLVPQPLITSSLSQNSNGHGFDPSIGNYTTSATDAKVQTAGPSLSVVRDYNSLDPRSSGAFGAGWSSLYDMKATEVDDSSNDVTSVVVTYPDGSEVGFGKNSDGTFAPPQGRFATLTPIANNAGYTLTDKNGTSYTFSQATSKSGVFAVTSVASYLKQTETFTYSGAELTAARNDVSGRTLHFSWITPPGAQYPHVTSVTTDPATPGDSSTALTWNYSYNADQLTSVCPPTSPGQCTQYTYTSGSEFPTAVLDAGPHSYWRMDEASGTTAASSVTVNEGSDNGTFANVMLGQPGPLPGSGATSASFNGTSSSVSLPSNLVYQSTYATISLWFKTTSTSAGMLFSTGNSAPGTANPSGRSMPVLYVGSDGKLYGHFWTTDQNVPGMSSPAAVNDGKWHLAVLTAAGDVQYLYLDGQQVGSLSGQLNNVDPDNMIGTGVFNDDGWPAAPSGDVWNYFDGQVSDAAFYGQYLPASHVQTLWATGTGAASLLNKITSPDGNTTAQVSYDPVTGRVTSVTDSRGGTWSVGSGTVTGSSAVFRSAVLGADPAGYWRLGETGAAAQADDEVNGGYGQYSNVTLGAPGPFQDETAATFNGSSSFVTLPGGLVNNQSQLSVGMWFKTTSDNGVLFSHSNDALTSSNTTAQPYTPTIYVGSDGKLVATLWNAMPPQESSAAVTDGNWHFVVVAGSGTSATVYLDGTKVGSGTGTVGVSGQANTYVGAGFIGGFWPDESHHEQSGNTGYAMYFNGSIGEVAFYRSALSAAQVSTQWAAYKSSSGVAPVETVAVTDPGGKTLTYRYDPRFGNRVLSQTDGLGNTTSYGYDTSGFQYTVTDPDGNVITTGHDVRGNVVSQTTCQDQTASKCGTQYYTYYPDDTSTTLTPDPRNDLVLTMRDARSASSTDPGYATTYTYDTNGNQVSLTTPPVTGFPNGRVTRLTYTTSSTPAADTGNAPAGVLASATSPGGGTETLTYYSDGDVATITDPAGEQTAYAYDGLGRVITKTVHISGSQPLVTSFTYNGQSQVLTQTDPGVTDHVTGAVHTARTTNAYDADGNLTSVTVADLTGGDSPRSKTYAYNSHDELASVTDAMSAVTKYAYDAYGNKVQQIDPAGNETDYTYDPNAHLLTTTVAGYTGDPASPAPARNLVEESRAYDPAGRLASVTDSMGKVTAYTYTDNGLLATVTRNDPASGQSFVQQSDSYDTAGNLTQKVTNNGFTTTTYTVDAADRTVSSTLDPAGLDRTTTYAYSPDDYVLTQWHTDAAGDVAATDYSYDPLGRMTSQSVHDDSAGQPAGWWPLSSGTAVYTPDMSGSANTGIVNGGVKFTAGHGAQFDGSSGAVSLPDNMVKSQTTLSVSLWFQTSSTSAGTLFSTGQSGPGTASPSGNAMPVLYVGSDGKLHGHFWTAAQDVPGMATSGTVNDGQWHHAVLTESASGQVLYLDGTQIGTLSGTPNNADAKDIIGAGVYNNKGWPAAPSGNTWNYFNGSIGNVQLYDRTLSPSDASALHTAGLSGTALDTRLLTTTWTLDQRGLPVSKTDPNGNTTSYLYDEAAKLAQVTGPAVNTEVNGGQAVAAHPVTSYGYDTFGDKVSTEDPDGNVTTTGYDADGRAVTQTLPSYTPPGSSAPITAVSNRAYNSLGQLVSATDALGNKTTYAYDQLGDTATVTDPAGGITHYTYDTNGDQLSVTNPAGAQTQATYDYLGRKLTSTQVDRNPSPAAYTTTYAYADTAGLLSSVTTPAGVTTSYAYDPAGERTQMTDGARNVTRYGYDLLGRQTSQTLPDGTSQHAVYDEAGNAIRSSQDDALGTTLRSTSAGYDANGNPTSATDAMGNATTFSYDAAGRLSSETQPVSASSAITTSFGYDAAGNMTRYTDGNGNATIYTYNTWNLRESTIVPATATTSSAADRTFTTTYNADGQAASKSSPGGVTVTDSYDPLGQLTGQSGSGADASTTTRSFGYDAVGDLTSASTSSGSSDSFTYDDRGLLLSASGASGSSSFGYNSDGQIASRTDASGTTSYGYDAAGRLSALTDGSTGTTLSYGYNSDSQVTSVQYGSGGATQTYSYNALHELTGDTLTSASGQSEASISYGYDLNGNETSKTTTGVDGASANTYTYDEANRLTSWNNGTTTVAYGYDADGNRTQAGSQTYTYDARDELTSAGGATYTYTARGTLASVTSAAGATVTSTSDAFNQVITEGTQTYSYDALGRVLSASARALSYSGMSNDVASDGTATYSRDPSGAVVAITSGGSSVLALTDQHRDVVGEFTASGSSLTGSVTYDPFGNVTAGTGMAGNLGYQSGWTDPGTGQVNMGSRWYSPGTGQFTSRDSASNSPVPASVTANTFAYGDDNPLTAYDPLGTCGLFDFGCYAGSVSHALAPAVHAIASAWNNFSSWAGAQANWVYSQAAQAVTNLVSYTDHVASAIADDVQDGLQWTQNAVASVQQTFTRNYQNVAHWIYDGGTAILATGVPIVYQAAQAVKYAAQNTGQFIVDHRAAIASFAASTVVFMGCEAGAAALGVPTAGVGFIAGTVACGALSGAVGNAVNYAMSTPMSKQTLGGFALQVGLGALAGAAGSLLGAFGSKLLGPVLEGVASRLGAAATDDAASSLAETGTKDVLDEVGGDANAGSTEPTPAEPPGGAGEPNAAPANEPGTSPELTSSEPSANGGSPEGGEPTSSEPRSTSPQSTARPAKPPHVFWSGGDPAMNAAKDLAQKVGGITLNMTDAGEALAKAKLPWEIAAPIWQDLSYEFAADAEGPAYLVYTSKGIGDAAIWLSDEFPTLEANPNVTSYVLHMIQLPEEAP